MGPKRADHVTKGSKLSRGSIVVSSTTGGEITVEQEPQQRIGKFAADLEIACREPPPAYPVPIPVYIRGHSLPQPSQPQASSQIQSLLPQSQQQQIGTYSGTSATPSLAGGISEEQLSTIGKKTSRARVPSTCQSGIFIGVTGTDNDNRSLSVLGGQEPSKVSSSLYKTFQVLDDSEFFRLKLLVDPINNETESIEQITALYMRAWQLDQHFIDILKRVVPLQEQLHTLNFCFIGLNEKTIHGFIELCQEIKNLKTVSLDGNPLASEHFYLLIEKDDSKIVNLSVRFCHITDTGAERLAHALGNMKKQNGKLLTLNLCGNRINDNGAKSFATALRYNRTLISLNLSSNFITDKSAILFALVLRRIVLTHEEIVQRRYLLAERYTATHPDDWRYTTSSPTPSNISTKSKSGRDSRVDWKRLTDPNKRKLNPSKIAQILVDKRNRLDSDETRPPSESKRGRNEGSAGNRSTIPNPPSATGTSSRRANANTPNTKDSDQPRTTAPVRVKKTTSGVHATTKKNISRVKEENEDVIEELNPSQTRQIERENPLLEANEIETHDGEIWLKGNFVLMSLNLSRNYLTLETVKEFLLSVQQQIALIHLNDTSTLSSSSSSATVNSLIDFSGLCRLELKGINDISTKSPEYQSLETLLSQKNPLIRIQQIKEQREAKELLDQPPMATLSDKATSVSEKTRSGSSHKSTTQRPTSRPKD